MLNHSILRVFYSKNRFLFCKKYCHETELCGILSLMRKERRIIPYIIILSLGAVLVLFLYLLAAGFHPLRYFSNGMHAETTIEDVADRVTEALAEGKDGEIQVYIKNVSPKDIKHLNYLIDTMKGNVSEYKASGPFLGVKLYTFYVERAESLFVYEAITEGKEIPEDKLRAKTLLKRVEGILAGVITPGMTAYQKELALHDFLVNNCTYGFGSEDDQNEYTAYGALIDGVAVCSGYAAAMNLLLSCVGIESKFIVGTATSSNRDVEETENHAWNLVLIDNEWYHLDVTWDDPVGERPILSHEFFNLSDEVMKKDHTWNQKKTEVCTSMIANYFVVEGLYFRSINAFQNGVESLFNRGYTKIECVVEGLDILDSDMQFAFRIPGILELRYSASGYRPYNLVRVEAN